MIGYSTHYAPKADFLAQLRKELSDAKQLPSLKDMALKHSLMYGSFQSVLEEEFAEKVS